MKALISVDIQMEYSWPTQKESSGWVATLQELSKREYGKLITKEKAMGHYRFTYEANHECFGMSTIALALGKHFPKNRYTMQATRLDASSDFSKSSTQGLRVESKPQQLKLGM